MVTICPLCQSPLYLTQLPPAPKAMACQQSQRGNGHLFEFLCYETGQIHHYKYNLLCWQITYWPPNPNYYTSKPHVVIRYLNYPNNVLYAGSTTKDFIDIPKITDYLKLLTVFS
jgi:hypothetical protein